VSSEIEWDPDRVTLGSWRVGRHRKRNIYAVLLGNPDDDVEVGRMESDEVAQYIVRLHNMALLRAENGARVVWPTQHCAPGRTEDAV
jgi:hypothetical protein